MFSLLLLQIYPFPSLIPFYFNHLTIQLDNQRINYTKHPPSSPAVQFNAWRWGWKHLPNDSWEGLMSGTRPRKGNERGKSIKVTIYGYVHQPSLHKRRQQNISIGSQLVPYKMRKNIFSFSFREKYKLFMTCVVKWIDMMCIYVIGRGKGFMNSNI